MKALSEIAARVLSELEEAHAENVTSTMNTIFAPTGSTSELAGMQSALNELIEKDLVRIAYAPNNRGRLVGVSKEASFSDVSSLPQRMAFSQKENLWKWDKAHPWAEILATKSGLTEAFEILDARGYQWWRNKS